MKFVLDKTTKRVKRYGYSDFEADGSFDPESEELVESQFTVSPGIEFQDWYWDAETGAFTSEPPQ